MAYFCPLQVLSYDLNDIPIVSINRKIHAKKLTILIFTNIKINNVLRTLHIIGEIYVCSFFRAHSFPLSTRVESTVQQHLHVSSHDHSSSHRLVTIFRGWMWENTTRVVVRLDLIAAHWQLPWRLDEFRSEPKLYTHFTIHCSRLFLLVFQFHLKSHISTFLRDLVDSRTVVTSWNDITGACMPEGSSL